MNTYIEDLIENYGEEDYREKIGLSITRYIKNEANYEKALELIINNNLSFEDVISRTCRLDLENITILADSLIKKYSRT